jgi:DNA-binding IclR family transcriptional regulator
MFLDAAQLRRGELNMADVNESQLRALNVFWFLANQPRAQWKNRDLANHFKTNEATMLRTLNTLASKGLATQTATGLWTAGPEWWVFLKEQVKQEMCNLVANY